jgi:hypothetical protein
MTDREIFEKWYKSHVPSTCKFILNKHGAYKAHIHQSSFVVWIAATLAERERCAKLADKYEPYAGIEIRGE